MLNNSGTGLANPLHRRPSPIFLRGADGCTQANKIKDNFKRIFEDYAVYKFDKVKENHYYNIGDLYLEYTKYIPHSG